ncbi:MAG TPA: hypothetical protein VN201_08925, partial [Roseateles sp.]|nr:hypothetical protein [Roseateles sp.]
ARAEATANNAMRAADEAVQAAKQAGRVPQAEVDRANQLIKELKATRNEAERERMLIAGGLKMPEAHEVAEKTTRDVVVSNIKSFLKRFGSESAASPAERLSIGAEIQQAAHTGIEITRDGKTFTQTGKLSVEVRSADWLTAKGNRFGARLGLEAKPEAEKAKSIFGLVPREDLIKERGGYIKSFLNTEGKTLGDKFQNWMRGNFYRGDQDIARATLTYVNAEGHVITHTLNNAEVLAMGDRMNLTLAAQGHTPSFLHGAHTTMDPLHGGYVVDEDTLKIIGGPGTVTQFKMDYTAGELLNRERNAGQYYNIIEGTGPASYWSNIWGKPGGADDARNAALNWQNISYNGHHSLVFDPNPALAAAAEERAAEVRAVLANADRLQSERFIASLERQAAGASVTMLDRTGRNFYDPGWVQQRFPDVAAARPDLVAPAMPAVPRNEAQMDELFEEFRRAGVVTDEMIRKGVPLVGLQGSTTQQFHAPDLGAVLKLADLAQSLWQSAGA